MHYQLKTFFRKKLIFEMQFLKLIHLVFNWWVFLNALLSICFLLMFIKITKQKVLPRVSFLLYIYTHIHTLQSTAAQCSQFSCTT